MSTTGETWTVAKVKLPYPHPGQRNVLRDAKRFNVLAAGRRWRKTSLAMTIAIEAAIKGGSYLWGAPTFDQVRIGWDEARKALGGVADMNQSRMTITFETGAQIIYRSLDNPDNARGHTANGIIIDEASLVKKVAWYEVLRPMLIDTDGWAWLLGTPKGMNWFYTEWNEARYRDDSMAWQIPTVGCQIINGKLTRVKHPLENPDVPFEEIKRLWETRPEQIFRQEILAEFIEDAGGVFRGVRDCATATEQTKAIEGHHYVFGVDWGKHNDFTVITVFDATLKALVAMDRFNQIDYALQRGRLMALNDRFKPVKIIAESNAMGEPIIEQLSRDGLPVEPFQTTNASKAQAVEALALAFEKRDIEIIPDDDLIAELQAYQMERLPSGLTRYNAPAGVHDDCVMAAVIGWQGVIAEPVKITIQDNPFY